MRPDKHNPGAPRVGRNSYAAETAGVRKPKIKRPQLPRIGWFSSCGVDGTAAQVGRNRSSNLW